MGSGDEEELSTFDLGAVCCTLFVFAVYHLYLYILKPQCFNGTVPFTIHMVNSEMWIKKHKEMYDPATTVLAIQTIRNTLMVGVFIGGNAINIAYSFANDYKDLVGQRWKVRSMVLMALLFSSFICWANVVRLGSTLGYMIGTMQYSEKMRTEAIAHERRLSPISDVNSDAGSVTSASDNNNIEMTTTKKRKNRKMKTPTFERIANGDVSSDEIPDIFREGSNMVLSMTIFFSLGFRLMFISIPFAFYAAGPLALIISAGCLMAFLPFYDHVPRKSPPVTT
eukprot:gene22057-25006_t